MQNKCQAGMVDFQQAVLFLSNHLSPSPLLPVFGSAQPSQGV
jgi:hypothetical protein